MNQRPSVPSAPSSISSKRWRGCIICGAGRVVGLSRAESRFEAATKHGLTPIVGRDTEISRLIESWRRVRETGSGRAAKLVSARAEMISTLRDRLRAEPYHIVVYRCSPFFVNSAFYPIGAEFERALVLG